MIARVTALLFAAALACSGAHRGGMLTAKSIDDVLAAHTDSLMKLPGVVGTAVGMCEGQRCIKVLVSDSSPDTKARIPSSLDGYRVVVEVTGPIRPR
jgi:hypothetical protein